MNVLTVKECSEQLKKLLAEQHNALDTRVQMQIREVIEALDVAVTKNDCRSASVVLLSISNILRAATNIAELISRL